MMCYGRWAMCMSSVDNDGVLQSEPSMSHVYFQRLAALSKDSVGILIISVFYITFATHESDDSI